MRSYKVSYAAFFGLEMGRWDFGVPTTLKSEQAMLQASIREHERLRDADKLYGQD